MCFIGKISSRTTEPEKFKFTYLVEASYILVGCLFIVLRPTRESFTHKETSPWPMKGCKTVLRTYLLWHRASVFPGSFEGPPHLITSTTHKGILRTYTNPDSYGSPSSHLLTTCKGMLRTYSNPDPDGSTSCRSAIKFHIKAWFSSVGWIYNKECYFYRYLYRKSWSIWLR
jgi:hypothetical protein